MRMATSSEHFVDPRRPVDRFLGNYSEDHRNGVNQVIHWICVPPIVWTVVAALWVLPVPTMLARPGLWAGLAAFAALGFYFRLSRALGVAMLLFFAALMLLTHWLYETIGASNLLWSAIGVFVVAWVAQFIGHEFEGKRPSFLTDLVYLLIGPLWLMSKLFRRLGLRW
jgi:uncharacterized membrane protein YGL010W